MIFKILFKNTSKKVGNSLASSATSGNVIWSQHMPPLATLRETCKAAFCSVDGPPDFNATGGMHRRCVARSESNTSTANQQSNWRPEGRSRNQNPTQIHCAVWTHMPGSLKRKDYWYRERWCMEGREREGWRGRENLPIFHPQFFSNASFNHILLLSFIFFRFFFLFSYYL